MYVCLVISMTCIEKKCLTQTPAQKSRVSYLRKREWKKNQLLTLMQAHWLKNFCNTILLTGSNNRFWNYESWIITTALLTNQIVVDKNTITNIQTRLVKLVLNGQNNCENSNLQFRIWLLGSVNKIQYPILWTNSCAKSCDP